MATGSERRFLRPHEAAARYGLSLATLEKQRIRGDGFPFAKVGRAVLYDIVRCDALIEALTRLSTSSGEAA